MKLHTIKSYSFSELPEDVQQQAIDNLRDLNVDYQDWCEHVIDDAKTIGALMGIEIDRIYYSGFSSQGDGACFEGSYSYQKGAVKAVADYAPQDTELLAIAHGLQDIQRPHFYQLGANVKHSGHYYHSMCTDVSVYNAQSGYSHDSADNETDDTVTELLRDYMSWIYARLEAEYYYLTSDDAVRESIEANEYDFTEDGQLY